MTPRSPTENAKVVEVRVYSPNSDGVCSVYFVAVGDDGEYIVGSVPSAEHRTLAHAVVENPTGVTVSGICHSLGRTVVAVDWARDSFTLREAAVKFLARQTRVQNAAPTVIDWAWSEGVASGGWFDDDASFAARRRAQKTAQKPASSPLPALAAINIYPLTGPSLPNVGEHIEWRSRDVEAARVLGGVAEVTTTGRFLTTVQGPPRMLAEKLLWSRGGDASVFGWSGPDCPDAMVSSAASSQSAVSPHGPIPGVPTRAIGERMFLNPNSAKGGKWWAVSVADNGDLVTRWGAVGAQGQVRRRACGSVASAYRERDEQVGRRFAHGYKEI